MHEQKFQYLLVDCDGVLLNSESVAQNAEMQVLRDFGLKLSAMQYREMTMGLSEHSHVELVHAVLVRTDQNIGLPELEDKLRKARWNGYRKHLRAMPQMPRLLEDYKSQIAVVSSSDRQSVGLKLSLAGIQSLAPERIFTARQPSESKEHTYRYALKQLGARGDDCLAVEDSVPGVSAARSVLTQVWGFVADNPHDEEIAEMLTTAGAAQVFGDPKSLRYAIDRAFSESAA